MNVMNYVQQNAQPLVSFLSMLSVGSRVNVEIDNHAKICLCTIDTPKDVLRLCHKCYAICGHHPKVYEISLVPDYEGGRFHVRCI